MLVVITGSMFCGKSERLISLAMSYVIAGRFVVGFKPSNDIRYDAKNIISHAGYSFPAHAVNPKDIKLIKAKILEIEKSQKRSIDVIVIDEAQFFTEDIIELVESLIYDEGKIVILAGLSQDSNGVPFGSMPHFLAIADDIIHLKAVCAVSKQIGMATRTYRKSHQDDGQIVVGGADIYEPRSFKEWLK